MAGQQGVETALQRGFVQWAVQTQGTGDVVRRALRVQLPEEPLTLLGVRQRQGLRAVGLEQRRCGAALLAEGAHEITQQGLLEQGLECDFQRQCLTHPRHHPRGQQGMPAQLEEVIVETDLRHLQHLGPDRRDLLFARGDGRQVALVPLTGIDLGQGLAVELAVGGQRQALEQQHVRRHHVVRQPLAQRGFAGL
ncbi:hypothetical protein [Pseudomonas sp. 31 R 17]|nr:hypothetical protein [Pseudomonas sp. 31 R 17]